VKKQPPAVASQSPAVTVRALMEVGGGGKLDPLTASMAITMMFSQTASYSQLPPIVVLIARLRLV
jgi:hypothetical protein